MISDFNYVTAILIFFNYVLMDVLYALYVISVGKRQAFLSAIYSSFLYSLGAFGVVVFSKNLLYLFPLASGAFIGTYVIVRFKK